MFKPLRYDSGKLVTLKTASSTTITKGDALVFSSGYVQRADNSATEVRFVAMEDVTTGSGEHKDILCLYVDGVEFEADTNGNTSQSLVGTYVDLTDHDTLNESASSNDVFYITQVVGAASDKKVRGYFVLKTS